MKSPYESWADSFQFTDDLKALEHVFQAEQKSLLKQQQQHARPQNGSTPETASSEPVAAQPTAADNEDLTLDMLSVKIAQRLAQFLGEPEVMSHYLKLHELQSDNEVMARQVSDLLEQMQRQEAELETLRQEARAYRRCFGRVYIKG